MLESRQPLLAEELVADCGSPAWQKHLRKRTKCMVEVLASHG